MNENAGTKDFIEIGDTTFSDGTPIPDLEPSIEDIYPNLADEMFEIGYDNGYVKGQEDSINEGLNRLHSVNP